MRSLLQDARFALRTLRRRPTFAVIAVVTIALGIGATTAIFSVVDAVLLRPLPFTRAGELIAVFRTYPHWREDDILRATWDRISFSYPTFREWRNTQTSFAELGAWAQSGATLSGSDAADYVQVLRTSPSLAPVLGIRLPLGRFFLPGEDAPSAPALAVISHEMWTSRFGGDRAVLGRTVRLDDIPYSIIGVLPPGTNLSGRPNPPSVWIAAGLRTSDRNRDYNTFTVVGRIKPDVSLRQASLETERLVRGGENPAKLGVRLTPWQREQTKTTRAPLLILLAAAGVLLLIACANVAMLLLGEAAGREHEMASRLALGAGHGRILGQLLIESVVLACLGGALGVVLAFAGTRALVAIAPSQIPRLDTVATDLRVLAFAFASAVGTGVLFGLLPAVSLAGSSPAMLLRAGSRSLSPRRGHAQRILVATELALCLVLLVGAGLLARSLTLLTAVDPGFRSDDLLVVKVGLSRNRYDDTLRLREFYRASLERIAAIPGVERVSASSGAPFDGSSSSTSLAIEGRPPPRDGKLPEAEYRMAMPGYFETVGIPLLAGRTFAATDRVGTPPVIVVNEALARRSWPNESAIGNRVRFEDAWHTVVGVTGDVKNAGLDADPQPMFYVSALQWETIGQRFVVRTRADAASFAPIVRRTIAAIDAEVPVTAVDAMPALISRSISEPRYRTVLIAVFAGIAGVLAVIGVYGVTSRAVTQQTREIGIRMALGSSDGALVRLHLVRTMVGVAAGVAVGAVVAHAAARVLAPYLYRVTPSDPLTYAAVLIPLVVVSGVASWIPARAAARVDPARVLRQ